MIGYDPSAELSAHYKLGDFTKTSQSLTSPNLPNEIYQYDNLLLLADVKEKLDLYIGPSSIISGFRTKELQSKLASQGEPTGTGVSFHEAGRAIDIFPTTMSIDEFFGLILANEDIKSMFAEIAIKPEQNALHLAINVPGDIRAPKVTGLNSAGSYVRLTVEEIANYIAPYVGGLDEAMLAAARTVTASRLPLYLMAFAGIGGALYLAYLNLSRRA